MVAHRVGDWCRGEASPLAYLTTRQLRLVAMAAAGWSNQRIAAHLGTEARTVMAEMRAVRAAVGVGSDRELVAWYWYSIALGRAQCAAAALEVAS